MHAIALKRPEVEVEVQPFPTIELARPRWPAVEEALRWYFIDSPGEMGLRSNFSAMVIRIQMGPSGGPASYELRETMLDAARRARRIKHILDGLDEGHAKVLRKAFGSMGPVRLVSYGRLATLVAQSEVAVEEHQRSMSNRHLIDWLGRLPHRIQKDVGAHQAYLRITREASRQLDGALAAYVEMRRKVGAHG